MVGSPEGRFPGVAAVTLLLGAWAMPTAGGAPPPLSDEALVCDAAGFSLRLPLGARVLRGASATSPSWLVQEPGDPPAWQLSLAVVDDDDPSGRLAMLMRTQAGLASTTETLVEPSVDDTTGSHRAWLQVTSERDPAAVMGWHIIPLPPGKLLLGSAVTTPTAYSDTRALLEAVFASVRRRSPQEIALAHRLGFLNSQSFLATLTPRRLQAMATRPRSWRRIYDPGPTPDRGDDREVGWIEIELTTGPRSSLTQPGESPRGDPEEGLLLGIRVRLRDETSGQDVFQDSESRYWLSWDGASEVWIVEQERRSGDMVARRRSETGVRTAPTATSPRPRMTIIRQDDRTNRRTPWEWEVPEHYCPQSLGWLMGALLPRDDVEGPRQYVTWFYDAASATPRLSLRTDHWSPRLDESGQWVLTTRLGSDGRPIRSIFGRDGELVREEHPDGTVVEPTTLAELRARWRSPRMTP